MWYFQLKQYITFGLCVYPFKIKVNFQVHLCTRKELVQADLGNNSIVLQFSI